ncbi:anthranilate phosphoribosyltransferase [Chlorobaculum sp. 24CR]|uniref:anthranilate phosphoribosyltransferase n=1 Tax=Chlorobaculum sp. 24CR TaxID=2508878 RepID=UPI00100B63FC|nr:anthranilate phosphoribosyltransferase [Chlorobaculum sp. 24CR]RXK89098.1 anthranilate phosphoribosyltransferase [Chlorobaculum sp. 24CR]
MRQQEILQKLLEGNDLSRQEMETCMNSIMENLFSEVGAGAILALLQNKGVTADEAIGACESIVSKATPVKLDPQAVDTCGTGGDHTGTFNISTAAAFIACGAGVPIAKHGNRSITSKCGSADVLEALGYRVDLPPIATEELFRETGFAFLFAPLYHPSMKAVASIRKELGIRTIFNMLGPVINPARVRRQLIGVFDPSVMDIYAEVLALAGCDHAMLVHGCAGNGMGMDEPSVCGPTSMIELIDGEVIRHTVEPEEFGLGRWAIGDLAGGDSRINAEIIREILDGSASQAKIDAALFASAIACYVSGMASCIDEGMSMSKGSLETCQALDKMKTIIETNQRLAQKCDSATI